jgi:predicted RNase H-like HicB family nuclease
MSRKYAVIFEQAETNWAAYVPDLPGCVTTGKTLNETERNIREAISGHIATLREFGETIPEPLDKPKPTLLKCYKRNNAKKRTQWEAGFTEREFCRLHQ